LLPRTDQRTELAPRLTVIIVAHQTGPALIECLDSLSHPDNPPHEIIVVDNGGNEGVTAELQRRPLLHGTTPFNVLPSEARNIGVHFARAPIACFLDDDATAEPGYLSAILTAFETYHIQ